MSGVPHEKAKSSMSKLALRLLRPPRKARTPLTLSKSKCDPVVVAGVHVDPENVVQIRPKAGRYRTGL